MDALRLENAAAIPSIGGLPAAYLLGNDSPLTDKIAPTLIARPEGNAMSNHFAYSEGFVLRNDGNSTEGGRKFINHFFSDPQNITDYVLISAPEMMPPRRDLLQSDAWQNHEAVQRYPELTELAYDNWDKLSAYMQAGDDGQPLYNAASANIDSTLGRAVDQLIVGGMSPEDAVSWAESELEGLGFST
jgi:multiple sugar transport system substrate-binding protein